MRLTDEARESAPYKKIDELKINDIIDGICNADGKQGVWIRKLDVVETSIDGKNYLSLSEPGGVAKCGKECETIVKSCEKLFQDEFDRDELSALLWKNKGTDVSEKVCKKWTKRCPNKKSIPTSYKRTDHPFKAISQKDLDMEQLMAEMKSAGMVSVVISNRYFQSPLKLANLDALISMSSTSGWDENV